MLSQTKENLQDIVGKLQLLDMALDTLGRSHTDFKDAVESKLKTISEHKLKLVDEIIRLSV